MNIEEIQIGKTYYVFEKDMILDGLDRDTEYGFIVKDKGIRNDTFEIAGKRISVYNEGCNNNSVHLSDDRTADASDVYDTILALHERIRLAHLELIKRLISSHNERFGEKFSQ